MVNGLFCCVESTMRDVSMRVACGFPVTRIRCRQVNADCSRPTTTARRYAAPPCHAQRNHNCRAVIVNACCVHCGALMQDCIVVPTRWSCNSTRTVRKHWPQISYVNQPQPCCSWPSQTLIYRCQSLRGDEGAGVVLDRCLSFEKHVSESAACNYTRAIYNAQAIVHGASRATYAVLLSACRRPSTDVDLSPDTFIYWLL